MEPLNIKLPPRVRERLERSGTSGLSSMTAEARERWLIEGANRMPGTLEGFACPDCLNRGYVFCLDEEGRRFVRECRCMVRRRGEARMERSGLSELLRRYTMENWQTGEKWQQVLKNMALDYAANPRGWFFLSGTPGTGKTHLCTALCGLLMERGMDTRYMLWRDLSVRAKASVHDDAAYQGLVEPLKQVEVLYIDDLFKTGKQPPTQGDLNLAFELLNARYNDSRLLTVLSSEWSIQEILDLDEATGSRIYERSKDHYGDMKGRTNWRMKGCG